MNSEKGYIIYLDLLGYQNIVKRNDSAEIEKLKTFIENFFNSDFLRSKASLLYNNFDDDKFLFRCYSDNFLLFYKSIDMNSDDFLVSILLSSFIIGSGIKEGYMMRGSIVYGEISYNNNTVFGNSIIEAYKLESGHIEPNIVLSTELKIKYEEEELYKERVLSPFSISDAENYSEAREYFDGIKKLVDRLNTQNIVEERTLAKYTWLVDEFNRYFKHYARIEFDSGFYHYDVQYEDYYDSI